MCSFCSSETPPVDLVQAALTCCRSALPRPSPVIHLLLITCDVTLRHRRRHLVCYVTLQCPPSGIGRGLEYCIGHWGLSNGRPTCLPGACGKRRIGLQSPFVESWQCGSLFHLTSPDVSAIWDMCSLINQIEIRRLVWLYLTSWWSGYLGESWFVILELALFSSLISADVDWLAELVNYLGFLRPDLFCWGGLVRIIAAELRLQMCGHFSLMVSANHAFTVFYLVLHSRVRAIFYSFHLYAPEVMTQNGLVVNAP